MNFVNFVNPIKFLLPFLYQQILVVKPGEPLNPKSPIVAILTTNGRIPKDIDPSQLLCIGHSSKKPICFDDTNPDDDLKSWKIFDFLNSHCKKLPNLIALTIRNGGGCCVDIIYRCMINSQLKYLNLLGFVMVDYGFAEERRNEFKVFPLNLLQELFITIFDSEYIDLPDFDNLEKFILHLTKPSCPISGDMNLLRGNYFRANQYKFLKYFEVLCDSPTLICHAEFDLPNALCPLHTFNCNATPEQARFTVYGTEDDNGVFIPGNDDWVFNLKNIKIRRDFYWFVETSKGAFEKRCFNDVTLKQGVIIEYSDVETKDPPSNLEIEYPPSDVETEDSSSDVETEDSSSDVETEKQQ